MSLQMIKSFLTGLLSESIGNTNFEGAGNSMSLKLRKIKSYLEAHSKQCADELNAKLGTQFTYSFDWECVPDSIVGWNLDEAKTKACLYHSYFLPIEQGLQKLFAQDDMYREAVVEQVKGFRVVPRDGMFLEFGFADGVMTLSQTLSGNQVEDGGGPYLERSVSTFVHAVENQLS